MSSNKIKTVKFKIKEKIQENGEIIDQLKMNLSKNGVKDLITKFQMESFQRVLSSDLKFKFKTMKDNKLANEEKSMNHRNQQINNLIRSSISKDFRPTTYKSSSPRKSISPNILKKITSQIDKKSASSFAGRNSFQQYQKVVEMIGLFIDKEYNYNSINYPRDLPRKSSKEELRTFEETNIEFIRNYVNNSKSVGEKIKNIIKSYDKNDSIRRKNSMIELDLNKRKSTLNLESSIPMKNSSYSNLSRNNNKDRQSLSKLTQKNTFNFFEKTHNIIRNGKSYTLIYPLLKKENNSKRIMSVEEVYHNIFSVKN